MTDTEGIDVIESNEEKEKKVLTRRLLDELPVKGQNIGAEVKDYSSRDITKKLLITDHDNNKDIFSNSSVPGIKEAIFCLFVGVLTNITLRESYIRSDTLKSGEISGVVYDYNGTNVFHIGNSWFYEEKDSQNTRLKFLGGRGLCERLSGTNKLGILGIEDNGLIALKKTGSNGVVKGSYIEIPGTAVSQIKKGSAEVFTVNDGKVQRVFLDNIPEAFNDWETPISYSIKEVYSFEEFGDIQQIRSDINDNFVLIVGKKGDKYALHILREDNWTTGEAIASIEGVKEFIVMPSGALLCVMEDGKIRKMATSFNQFEKGYFEKGGDLETTKTGTTVVRNNAHERMLETLHSTKLTKEEEVQGVEELDVSEQDVISGIWSKKIEGETKTIKELLDEAQSEKQIKKVEKQINKLLTSISSFAGSIKIKNHIRDVVIKKKTEIILKVLGEEVDFAEKSYNEAENMGDYIRVKSLVEGLHERRKNLEGGSAQAIELGTKIKELRKNIEKKIEESREKDKEKNLSIIQKNIEELKNYAGAISYGRDLSGIYNLSLWKETMELIDCLNEEERKRLKAELYSIVQKKSEEFQKEEQAEEENKKSKIQEQKKVIGEDIDVLISMLETIHSVEAINEMKINDPLVKKIEEEIKSLSPSEGGELEIKYKKVFKDRIFNIRREKVKEKGITQNLDESGIDTMLYYVSPENEEIERKLRGTPISNGMIRLELSLDDGKRKYSGEDYFENSDKFSDVLIGNKIKFEVTQAEYIELNNQLDDWRSHGKARMDKLYQDLKDEKDKEKRKSILKKIYDLKSQYPKARYVEKLADRLIKKVKLTPRDGVPKVNHEYIVLDEERQSLQDLSGNLLNQKKRSGVTILEGGPGLGKTVMCEYLAAVTNREMVRVQCSKKISYSEFFFAPTLKKSETSRSPAEWIKMMQKPGTIILFDEIDKLNAECMAGLHALFDSGRHVHDPQLGDFYANPDCLFVGTMNSYDPLPKAIASRATIQRIEYPSEVNEAYKISKYVDDDFLKELNYEEFKEVRNNQDTGKGKTKNSKEHKFNEILHNIRKLLKVFQLLRAKYEDEYERFEYEISYRDAAQIFSAYSISHNFKKAVSNILINKASSVVGTESQKEQKDMVKQVIKQVFG